jgi:hypothetical protein
MRAIVKSFAFLAIGCGCIFSGFLAGRNSIQGSEVCGSGDLSMNSVGQHPSPPPPRSSPPKFPTPAAAPADDACSGTVPVRQQRARAMFSSLVAKANMIREAVTQSTPESRANELRGYIQGEAAAIRQINPLIIPQIAEEFTRRFCHEEVGEDEAILLAYVGTDLPEATSREAFDCFFSSGRKEGPALWYMLDALKQSGQSPPPALAEVRRKASDPRTLRRLDPDGNAPRNRLSIP